MFFLKLRKCYQIAQNFSLVFAVIMENMIFELHCISLIHVKILVSRLIGNFRVGH